MSRGRNLLAASLAVVAGSLWQTAAGQDYVDLEAERAAATQPSPADPYAPRGAQNYSATSYGVGSAPAATTAAVPSSPATAGATPGTYSAPPPAASQDQNLGTLFIQIQQLQQEVMRLNGRLEEQANEIRTLREQSLQRYVDLDKRLSGGGATAAPQAAPGSTMPEAAVAAAPRQAPATAQPGEAEAYRAAYSLVQAQQFEKAGGQLWLWLVRAYVLQSSLSLVERPMYDGSRRWVKLEGPLPTKGARAVLPDDLFERRVTSIRNKLTVSRVATSSSRSTAAVTATRSPPSPTTMAISSAAIAARAMAARSSSSIIPIAAGGAPSRTRSSTCRRRDCASRVSATLSMRRRPTSVSSTIR